MKQLAKILIGLAAACIAIALILKVRAGGGVPASPMMWLKLGGLTLLFSIALSLFSK